MALKRLKRFFPRVCLIVCLPLLAACENSATAFHIGSSQHALTLIREQQFFWTKDVEQAIVVSYMPACQRRVKIHSSAAEMVPMEIYEAGDMLWALRQGARWYLASTARCLVQDWDNAGNEAPGPLAGYFAMKDGKAEFFPAENAGNQ